MADVEIEIEETMEEGETLPFVQMAHKVLLAGIGAVALAQEEIEAFVEKLVERGEIAEKDGRKMVKDVMERRRKRAEAAQEEAQGAVQSAAGEMDRNIERILHRMNVPTKSDIDSLSEKISQLSEKVDQLRQTQSG